MELDKRIKNNHRPLCVIDIKWAIGFIGQNGFFADAINCFENLSECQNGKLVDAEDNKIHPFECDNEWNYMFFIPEEWVKEPEKKWRPYTGIEFAEKFGIWVGHIIRIRDRPENAGQEYEYKIMFVGYRWYKGMFEVFINGCWIDLLTLFELYEYMEDGEWHKFGVEE